MDKGYSWLRLLVDSSFASRFLIDRLGNIVFANRAAESLFGYAPGELTGRPIDVMFASPTDRDLAIPQRYIPARRIVGDKEEIRGRTKEGRNLILRIGTSPIETDAASFLSVTVFDITRYKQTESELLFRGRQLEEAKRRVSKFAFLAANDLRDRLNRVASRSASAKTALAAGDLNAAMEANEGILDATAQAGWLVDALLEYSLQATEILKLEFIQLRSEVDAVLDKLSGVTREAGVKIENNVPSGLRIKADRPLFMRLVRDLVEKSMAIPRSSKIIISATCNEDSSSIRLGIGGDGAEDTMSPSASSNSASSCVSSGVDLAAVRSICEQHGWTIECESCCVEGGKFKVNIPLGDPSKSRQPAHRA